MKKPRKCFVQLGRTGDIINVLPLAKIHFDTTGERPLFMVALEFAAILDGVSYVTPFIYYGPWEMIHPAVLEARKQTTDITVCQIHGWGLTNSRQTTSFARESWVQAGSSWPWGLLPLVFDRRDHAREEALLAKLNPSGGPFVLFAGSGTSSPFPYAKPLLDALRSRFGPKTVPICDTQGLPVDRVVVSSKINVIDLSGVKAERFFDLLGLFEKAVCLIAIDTAHQHLAAAIPELPVIALRTREPVEWHGSPWRAQHVMSVFYDEFPQKIEEVVMAVAAHAFGHPAQPRIIHAWADWRNDIMTEDNVRRCEIAESSWRNEYALGQRWVPVPIDHQPGERDGRDIGDVHPVPFLHDIVERACAMATSRDDIIALTNADIGFTPGLTGWVIETVARYGSAYTHRRDFDHIPEPFLSEAAVRMGQFYPGTDAFFFTVGWWKAHRAEYGDFIMGREHWDEVLRQLVKYHGGREIDNAVWHEWHESYWCGPERYRLAGNLHNLALKEEWFARTGLKPEDFRWWHPTYESCAHPEPQK